MCYAMEDDNLQSMMRLQEFDQKHSSLQLIPNAIFPKHIFSLNHIDTIVPKNVS